jgi:hypothetical protein
MGSSGMAAASGRDNVTQEVGVDAKTGKLLENKPEGANPD